MALPGTSLTHYQVSPSSTFASSSTNGTATSSTSTLTASSTSATVARRHESTTSSTVSTSSSSRRSNRRLSSSTSSTITSQRQFEWIDQLKCQLSFQTIMRLLQVLVPQVEKICIDKGLTEDSEIVKFLQNGTLVGLLPVPHPILIRKYQSNAGTAVWFRNYVWGVIYLRNVNPPIWYDTNVRLFEIQPIQPIQ